jgi:hypothetical protein
VTTRFNPTKERIRLLSRMNRGRTAIPSFLSRLSEAVGEPVGADSLVPLPETDVLMDSLRRGYQLCAKDNTVGYRKFFSPQETRLVFQIANCLAQQVPKEIAFLVTKLSEYCGAVRLPLRILLSHSESIIHLDGDSLSALSMDQAEGIIIDLNADDLEQRYEVALWGNRWPLIALACDTKHNSSP